MIVRVECYAGHRGDHRYFKLCGADRATYIPRHDEPGDCWELTPYQAPPREREAAP